MSQNVGNKLGLDRRFLLQHAMVKMFPNTKGVVAFQELLTNRIPKTKLPRFCRRFSVLNQPNQAMTAQISVLHCKLSFDVMFTQNSIPKRKNNLAATALGELTRLTLWKPGLKFLIRLKLFNLVKL